MNDITAIQNYSGQYAPSIIRAITEQLSVADDMYVIRNLTAPRKLWRYVANKGLRPIDTSVEDTTREQGKFSSRTITPKTGMKILKVIPEELRQTFLSEQLDPNAKEYPQGFSQYFWEEQGKALAEEIELNVGDSFDPDDIAAFDAADTYTVGEIVKFTRSATDGEEFFECISATTAAQSPTTHPAKWENANARCVVKGICTIVKEERTAGNLAGNVINTGAITNTNALTVIDGSMWDAIPEKVKKVGVTFYVSHSVFNKRVKALRQVKNDGTYYTEAEVKELRNQIIDSNGKGVIKACSWMGESQLIIATIKDNLVMGTNQLSDFNSIGKMVETLHGYKTILKMILAFQVQDLSVLFVNDQN
ncbi:hypothetical protein [Telluribacter humicola]|uniref:hypothetical protein n=1 Tax=Telluribacter humicola TaxID=1720261 RepID=UPI001A960FCF|nr:hypothetical protein [Telluribacter humicola]